MKWMVTGHRKEKLLAYDEAWIKEQIYEQVYDASRRGMSLGMSGMASGVDLWFCRSCLDWEIPFVASRGRSCS